MAYIFAMWLIDESAIRGIIKIEGRTGKRSAPNYVSFEKAASAGEL